MTQENTARSLDPSELAPEASANAATASPDGPLAKAAPAAGGALSPSTDDGGGDAASAPSGASLADLALLGDISVSLSMEIGRTDITISELLSLGRGSVVELQRMADEPLDILVNGTLVAHGEAVVVGERFGIRLTDVVSQRERLAKLA